MVLNNIFPFFLVIYQSFTKQFCAWWFMCSTVFSESSFDNLVKKKDSAASSLEVLQNTASNLMDKVCFVC